MQVSEHAHAALVRLTTELRERSVEKLPPERELATRLGTSRTTIRKAIDRLERDGLVRRVRGRTGGAYLVGIVSDREAGFDAGPGRRLARNLNTVKGVPQMLHEQGFQDGTRVLSAELVAPTPQVREILRIPAGNPVVSLLRLRFADGDTLSLERMYLRGVQPILGTALTSIYETLRSEFGITIAATEESIELASATAQTGGLLDQPVNTALLRLERIGYDQGDSPVEYSVDLFRADRTRLSVRTRG